MTSQSSILTDFVRNVQSRQTILQGQLDGLVEAEASGGARQSVAIDNTGSPRRRPGAIRQLQLVDGRAEQKRGRKQPARFRESGQGAPSGSDHRKRHVQEIRKSHFRTARLLVIYTKTVESFEVAITPLRRKPVV